MPHVSFFSKLFLLISFSILTSFCFGPEKPTFAKIWREEFILNSTSTQTKIISLTIGQMWYNWEKKSVRHDYFYRSQADNPCTQLIPESACTVLLINSTFYAIFAQKQICCYQSSKIEIASGFPNSTYEGTKLLEDNKLYNYWSGVFENQNYFDTIDTRIPRRYEKFEDKRIIAYDFIPVSYSERSFEQSVFAIPSYCDRKCPKKLKLNKMMF